MLADSKGKVVVSNLGWVDHGNLWVMDTGRGRADTLALSEAKYVSLHPGTNDYFSVNHRFDGARAKITVHHFANPGEMVASAMLTSEGTEMVGDLSVWSNVQKHYVAYYTGPFWSASCLLQVTPQAGQIELQQFGWYNSDYDKGYQGVIGVVECPDNGLLIVSVQRDSHPVLYDPNSQRRVGTLELCNRGGNPTLFFRRRANELWADDYDTVVKLEPGTWRVVESRRLQSDAAGTRQFIGSFAFDPDEKLCLVARPFSRDVVGIDPTTLQTRFRCALNGQPLEAMALPDGTVIARDWKSGALLRGQLTPSSEGS
jgi:hypothetical protein